MNQTQSSTGSSDGPNLIDDGIYFGNIAAACAATNAETKVHVGLSEEEQKKRRLQMNRNNAQRNRDRKRIMIDMLQSEKRELTASNETLRKENATLRKHIADLKLQRQNKRRKLAGGTPQSIVPATTKLATPTFSKKTSAMPSQPSRLIPQNGMVNAFARNLLMQQQMIAKRANQTSNTFGSASGDISKALLQAQENLRKTTSGLAQTNNVHAMCQPSLLSRPQPFSNLAIAEALKMPKPAKIALDQVKVGFNGNSSVGLQPPPAFLFGTPQSQPSIPQISFPFGNVARPQTNVPTKLGSLHDLTSHLGIRGDH